MTHTLHRFGEKLEEDYVTLIMPSKDINHIGAAPKLKRYLELALESGAIKIGDCRHGNEYHQGNIENILKNLEDQSVVHAVFKDRESLAKALRAYKQADLGLCVVVSGLFDHVGECCREAGLENHTINQSMGRWGLTDKLPPPEILAIYIPVARSTGVQLTFTDGVLRERVRGISPTLCPCILYIVMVTAFSLFIFGKFRLN